MLWRKSYYWRCSCHLSSLTQAAEKGWDMRSVLTSAVTDLQGFLTNVSIKKMKSNVAMGENRYNCRIWMWSEQRLKEVDVEWSKGIHPSHRMGRRNAAEYKSFSITLKRVEQTFLYTIFFMQITKLKAPQFFFYAKQKKLCLLKSLCKTWIYFQINRTSEMWETII